MKFSRPALLAMASILAVLLVTPASTGNAVIHFVSAGGPDVCRSVGLHPGCDGNFSLVALVKSDGSVSGQYTDQFANGDGFHAVIDCVSIVGNDAWVSGVVTNGNIGTLDLTGFPVVTRVRDNGTSKKDPTDQIHFSRLGDATPCTARLNYVLLDAPEGQVIVK